MKTFFIFLSVIALSFSAQAQYKKAVLQASGLTCAMCSRATLKALETLPFVDKIDTDLNATSFILHFKPNTAVNIDAIGKKVEDAGFFVAKLVMTADFDKLKVTNDAHVNYAGQTLHFVNVKDQVLQGEKDITIVDKAFVSAKQYKKYSEQVKMACYKTGTMADCCKPSGSAASKRVIHVTI
ncbi:heavy metal-associated domain-containing protein [uncultured Chitinophaga sp.]|uniref:heavy-metal-associated domain-containing protein n=1 Tax=uncultured Chitinophaga sp. TaxID=339340 RepID=UPI0025FA342D|nr:heavy metal-associated domain-containing protein [uncultured Chitinophaga sp.]